MLPLPQGAWPRPVELLTGIYGACGPYLAYEEARRLLAACVALHSPYLVREAQQIAGGGCPPTPGHLYKLHG